VIHLGRLGASAPSSEFTKFLKHAVEPQIFCTISLGPTGKGDHADVGWLVGYIKSKDSAELDLRLIILGFTSDSRQLIVARPTGSLRLISIETGAEIWVTNLQHSLAHLRCRPQNDYFAGVRLDDNRVIEFRDVSSGQSRESITLPSRVGTIAWSADGRQLFAGLENGFVQIRGAEALEEVTNLRAHEDNVVALGCSRDGRWLMTQSWDRSMKLWELPGLRPAVAAHGIISAYQVQFSLNGGCVASAVYGSVGGLMELIPATILDRLHVEPGSIRGAWGIDVSADGCFLALAHSEGIEVADLKRGQVIAHCPIPARSVIFAPDGRTLFTCGGSAILRWRLHGTDPASASVELVGPQTMRESSQIEFHYAALSGDGRWLAAANRQAHTVALYDVANPTNRFALGQHPDVSYITFSPDGRLVATGTWKGKDVMIWDVAERRLLRRLPTDASASVWFSPDNRLLLHDALCWPAKGAWSGQRFLRPALRRRTMCGVPLRVWPQARVITGLRKALANRSSSRVIPPTLRTPRSRGCSGAPGLAAISFSAKPPPMEWTRRGMYRTSLASCAGNRNFVYAVSSDSEGYIYTALRSTDGGQTWSPCGKVFEGAPTGYQFRFVPGNQGNSRNQSLAVSPSDPNRVAFGWRRGPFVSLNGGDTWRADAMTWNVADPSNPPFRTPHQHGDLAAVYSDPYDGGQNSLYVGSDGGLIRTPDLGLTFGSIYNRNLANLDFVNPSGARSWYGSLGVSLQGGDLVIGSGSQDNGNLYCYFDGLSTTPSPWFRLGGGDGDLMSFIETGNLLSWHNGDANVRWARWSASANAFNTAGYVDVQPAYPSTAGAFHLDLAVIEAVEAPAQQNNFGQLMYAVAGRADKLYALYADANGANIHWTPVGTIATNSGEYVSGIGSFDGARVFIGTSKGRIFRLDMSNLAITPATFVTAQFAGSAAHKFAFLGPTTLFVCMANSGTVYRTLDGGTWSEVTRYFQPGLPHRQFAAQLPLARIGGHIGNGCRDAPVLRPRKTVEAQPRGLGGAHAAQRSEGRELGPRKSSHD
jgi:WD40 repeat protein